MPCSHLPPFFRFRIELKAYMRWPQLLQNAVPVPGAAQLPQNFCPVATASGCPVAGSNFCPPPLLPAGLPAGWGAWRVGHRGHGRRVGNGGRGRRVGTSCGTVVIHSRVLSLLLLLLLAVTLLLLRLRLASATAVLANPPPKEDPNDRDGNRGHHN